MKVHQNTTRTVVFKHNDGSDNKTIWSCEKHQPVGKMPVPVRDGYVLVGWYTLPGTGEGSRFMERDSVERNMTLYAHWKKDNGRHIRHRVEHNNVKDTWDNDSRNQTSLDLGTAEYEEYVKDHQENAPSKPDDQMHVELEARNAEYPESLTDDLPDSADVIKQKRIQWQMAKRAMDKRIHASLVSRAKQSPTLEDDAKLKLMEKDDHLIYDEGVTPDNYDDMYMDIVFNH